MPESSKQGIRASQRGLGIYPGKLILLDEFRSDEEPPDAIVRLQIFGRYVVLGLRRDDIPESTTATDDITTTEDIEKSTTSHELIEKKTDALEQHPDLAAVLKQIGYPSSDAPREKRERGSPALMADGARHAAPSPGELDVAFSTSDILNRLADPDTPPATRQQLVCEAELLRFSQTEGETLLKLLWQYILDHRDNNDPGNLVAVGSAIRKSAAIMPMDQIEDLAVLIEPGHRAAPPIELELEVAKMVYRNFEVYPPAEPDQQSQLTAQLWRLAQDYLNPRFLLREKHSAVAPLAIEALIAMRSSFAEPAWRAALECRYSWFSEMVSDHVATLRSHWLGCNDSAVTWLDELQSRVMKANL